MNLLQWKRIDPAPDYSIKDSSNPYNSRLFIPPSWPKDSLMPESALLKRQYLRDIFIARDWARYINLLDTSPKSGRQCILADTKRDGEANKITRQDLFLWCWRC